MSDRHAPPPGPGGTISGRKLERLDDESHRAVRAIVSNTQRVEAARRASLVELDWHDVKRRGIYLVSETGRAYMPVTADPFLTGQPLQELVDAFTVQPDGTPVFLKKTAKTAGQLDPRATSAAIHRREAALERQRFLREQKKTPLRLEELAGRELPTLREAALVIESFAGTVEEANGRLVILLPARLDERGKTGSVNARLAAHDACRVLLAEAETVLPAIQGKDGKLSELLADRPALAACEP